LSPPILFGLDEESACRLATPSVLPLKRVHTLNGASYDNRIFLLPYVVARLK